MAKIKIRTKLFITYCIILIITFTVTVSSFNILSQRYLINEARQQLKTEGRLIAGTLKNAPLSNTGIKDVISKRRDLKIAGRFIDSNIIVFNKDRKIIYTNFKFTDNNSINRRTLLNLTKSDKAAIRDYVAEHIPIWSKEGDLKGNILLITKVKDINSLNKLMQRAHFLSLIIASFISLIIALIFGKSLTNPIRKLMNSMTNFSKNKSSGDLKIKTGDEIEELALCFNHMSNKLKEYNKQQKRFLQNTSHELKTPLMSIQGYAEAIKDGVVEGKELEAGLDIIIEESQRLKKVVNEIIYLTKLENVEEAFNFENKNIGEIIKKAVQSVKSLANEKGISIDIEGNFNYTIFCDADKLYRAFINILGNCIRFAKNSITINDTLVTADKVEIQVTDDGIGFNEGEEKRIFDRFYKGKHGGTGIGLAITKAIIEGHKGNIEAFNNYPHGAVFKIVIYNSLN